MTKCNYMYRGMTQMQSDTVPMMSDIDLELRMTLAYAQKIVSK